jgi:MFS family permease
MWIAALVSNVGSWMQLVGAQWLLVGVPHAAILVALVQACDMVPDLLFGLVGGVIADSYDRRRVLLVAQGVMFAVGLALTILTFAHALSPPLLLMFTLLLGFGSVPVNPAYQSLVPELVPRDQVPAAAALSSVSVNLARAIGPAIAGVVIARAGVGTVFAINSATFLVFAVVVAAWHPEAPSASRLPEPFGSAMRAGSQYVRHSPVVRRIFARAALFLVPASAL